MGFRKLPDGRGMLYVPECPGGEKKNPCPDCFSCQWCANERCRVCKGGTKRVRGKTQKARRVGNRRRPVIK